jgi:hypothetical protein
MLAQGFVLPTLYCLAKAFRPVRRISCGEGS